ncbi:MAG: c-type cytochrome, partial [Sulfitobacter sp.]
MKRIVRVLVGLVMAGLVMAAAIVGLGLYNVSARQGHLPGVTWLMHTTFRQSVRLRAPGKDQVPEDISNADRIALGAQHFETACAFCHAAPGQRRSATARAMNPAPPHITDAVDGWEPQHMFWIVREGVKMTGMPYWPATGRDDEVWSVVAYLDALRDGNANDQATVPNQSGEMPTCTRCHGNDGRSSNSFIPRLDILTKAQISEALLQYRDGTRSSGFMAEAARDLTGVQIDKLAEAFGRQAAVQTDLSEAD